VNRDDDPITAKWVVGLIAAVVVAAVLLSFVAALPP
jgi:hypothetical protein